MNTLTPTPTMEATGTWTPRCVKQDEVECGFCMLLHIFLAGTSTTCHEFLTKINKLNKVENVPRRCRHWIYNILINTMNDWEPPPWILDLQANTVQTNTNKHVDN